MEDTPAPGYMERGQLDVLLQSLAAAGYRCIGPRPRDGAIVYESLETADQLPRGWRDTQAPGRYRLMQTDSPRQFAWANGPQALKPLLFAPREELWRTRRDGEEPLAFEAVTLQVERLAVIGVRGCDLAALALQDAHFLGGEYPDPAYRARREGLFLVAVDCSHPAATCFCASTGDGPAARGGDLRLQELEEGFLVSAGSAAGEAILRSLPIRPATEAEVTEARKQLHKAERVQQRRLPAGDHAAELRARQDHPHWHTVAQRCLACGNCTSVCPTCFCYSEADDPALNGTLSTHYRVWDSCFSESHSYIHGIVIRAETRHRYRQWLTHKLGTWPQQYGRSGCVGCGRCISWCPAGIDLTAEVEALCHG
ncbi:MAG TPA: sulfite reductase subunit A [Gammaproteobacteria bacterium]|nr:sulfite reductase subunit A [Gammaproteobacteria bacterium]